MRRANARGAVVAVALILAGQGGCSSSGGAPGALRGADASADGPSTGPDAASDAGHPSGDTGSDAPVDAATDATAMDAPSGTDGGDSGNVLDAADASDAPAFASNAVCSPTTTWSAGALLPISTSSDDELDSITPDERTIVWTVGQGSGARIAYADRASSADSFGAPQMLAAGQYTSDRVALSDDGLTLVVVNAGAQGFSELTRTSRSGTGSTFGAATTGAFANLNGATLTETGQSYGNPVLGAHDVTFYYSLYGGSGQTATIYRTARLVPGDTWPVGGPVSSTSGLAAQASLRCRPTSISSDEQTLFFWDEITSSEKAAWIAPSSGTFDFFVDLGARSMAAPNAACTSLYYSAQGSSTVNLFEASN